MPELLNDMLWHGWVDKFTIEYVDLWMTEINYGWSDRIKWMDMIADSGYVGGCVVWGIVKDQSAISDERQRALEKGDLSVQPTITKP